MGAQMSTTSEGLWLTAALSGITRLPGALRVRPVGDTEAMLASHPGLQVLEEAGVCQGRTLDSDVRDWLLTLGRCDIDVSIQVIRPDERSDRLTGPPEIFTPRADPLRDPHAAAAALRAWRTHQSAERTAVLCRRDGKWVVAARVWRIGDDPIDDVTVSPLEGDTTVFQAVNDLLGDEVPADFEGINIEPERLEAVLSAWQLDRQGYDVIGELLKLGLTARQARIIVAVSDTGAVRAAIAATQYSVDGPEFAASGAMVVDSLMGRVVISSNTTDDQQRWTMLFPGTTARVSRAVSDVLHNLPSGTGWERHQRIQAFQSR
ncbi:ESX secretion-associated protein EspG [Mycolicibacterium sphagni]|uniref:ESX secretion-associated protein EspG n=2 Tax=Mycolicibacterium sphagni TaxID=1786 RepID=A0ABX2K629_9MYCO|nr:ESX secretion-associated protein EspG [Mycolicibacterium sphagni]